MFLKIDETTLIDLTGTHITTVCKGKPKDNEEADFEIWHLIVIHDITAFRQMYNVRSDTDLAIRQNFSNLESYPEPADDYSSYTIIQKCESPKGVGSVPFMPLIERIEAALQADAKVLDITDVPEWIGLDESKEIAFKLAHRTEVEQNETETWNQRLLDEGDPSSELLSEGEDPDVECEIQPTVEDEKEPPSIREVLKETQTTGKE